MRRSTGNSRMHLTRSGDCQVAVLLRWAIWQSPLPVKNRGPDRSRKLDAFKPSSSRATRCSWKRSRFARALFGATFFVSFAFLRAIFFVCFFLVFFLGAIRAVYHRSYKSECQETFFPSARCRHFFGRGIQPNYLNAHSRSTSDLPQTT